MPPCPAHHPDTGIWTGPSSLALHVAPIAAAPLRRMSTCLFCHHAEPSPPILSPGAARVTPMQCTAIKGGDPIASRPLQRPCPPLVSRHRRAHLCFPPCHRCRATSPLLSPRAQVQEFCQSSELHPNPKDRHLPADRPAATAHATLHALHVVIAPELPLHASCEPCGRRLMQSTRTMLDHSGPSDTI
jgi:hypothetical protein